ncbi:MAG: transferase [Candidatus Eremiobacteraeota bacterium]|nr:transferase [Candidatus Eremiobacteraeota bacterium]
MPSPLFFELHSSLPREGPGDDATTRSVLLSLDLPQAPKVLDVGCGPGAGSLVLARESGGTETLHWLDGELREIDVARRHGDAVGYVFYVMRRSD